jgi:hypothetical protein
VRCAAAVYLTLGEYAAVRAIPGRFAVAPGHERRGERVSENERFVVVEAPLSAAA